MIRLTELTRKERLVLLSQTVWNALQANNYDGAK